MREYNPPEPETGEMVGDYMRKLAFYIMEFFDELQKEIRQGEKVG